MTTTNLLSPSFVQVELGRPNPFIEQETAITLAIDIVASKAPR